MHGSTRQETEYACNIYESDIKKRDPEKWRGVVYVWCLLQLSSYYEFQS